MSVRGGRCFLGKLLAWHTPLSPSAEACHMKKESVGQSQCVCGGEEIDFGGGPFPTLGPVTTSA